MVVRIMSDGREDRHRTPDPPDAGEISVSAMAIYRQLRRFPQAWPSITSGLQTTRSRPC